MGVWIETTGRRSALLDQSVTPCVGVWIETFCIVKPKKGSWVTPCVGVWIETALLDQSKEYQESHPAWVCGLKLSMDAIRSFISSHTLRGCVD